jgi:putative tryptophan/tyrosine transport system substrate-binding protein
LKPGAGWATEANGPLECYRDFRQSGNLTGVLQYEASITGKWLAMLKEISPTLVRAALVANPKTTPFPYFQRAALALAPSLAIELVASPVQDASDIERTIESFARESNGGFGAAARWHNE